MSIEKACDRVHRETMWDVLNVCGVDNNVLAGVKAFHRDKIPVQTWSNSSSKCRAS